VVDVVLVACATIVLVLSGDGDVFSVLIIGGCIASVASHFVRRSRHQRV
jgi:hypothetical protein